MKNILYIGILLILLGACQEEETPLFRRGNDGIQFNYDAGKAVLDYNFAEQYHVKNGTKVYYGDSFLQDTVSLYLTLSGLASDREREFKLKTVLMDKQDSAKVAEVVLEDSYRFKANQTEDTIRLVVKRPAGRGLYTVGVTFELSDPGMEFSDGVVEKMVYRLNISDRYTVAAGFWDAAMYLYGEYSEEKYAFIVTVTGMIVDPNDYMWWMWTADYDRLKKVQDALKAYNDAHPDNPKDFTI